MPRLSNSKGESNHSKSICLKANYPRNEESLILPLSTHTIGYLRIFGELPYTNNVLHILSNTNNYNYKEYLPSPELGEYVECYWTFTGPKPPDNLYQGVLPNGCSELVIHFGSLYKNLSENTEFIEPQVALFGPIRSISRIAPLGQVKLAAIRFKPTGLFRLFKVPTHYFANQILDSTEFKDVSKSLPLDKFIECDFYNIAPSFDELLLKCLYRSDVNNSPKRIEFAINHIQASNGILAIAGLPGLVNLSERHFEQLFKDHVGLSAKNYASIVRFNNILNLLLMNWDKSLTELAHLYNYYDQAHFIKDFKKMTGLSPTGFLKNHKGNFFFDKD